MRISRFLVVAGFAATVCTWPNLAQDKLERKEAQVRAFLVRHDDQAVALKREGEFHQALLERNLKWIADRAKQFESEATEFARNGEDLVRASHEGAYVMGTCHLASFALHEAIVQVSNQGLPRKLPAQVDEVVPLQTRERFAENMRRCELVRRLPLSERLIGARLT